MNLVLIDAKNAVFRFGYAHRGLSYKGRPTGSLYGMCNVLLRLKKKYWDSVFVMVWDEKTPDGKTWRHKVLPTYKHRDITILSADQQQLHAAAMKQLAPMKELCNLLNIPCVGVPGVEADDLIGILSAKCPAYDLDPIIYSSDKDYCQLMRYGVRVIRDINKVDKLAIETAESVFNSFSVPVKDVLKLRAMVGDSSDRINGAIKRVGHKTAAKWIGMGLHPGKRYGIPVTIPKPYHGKVCDAWKVIRLNYRVMRILRDATSKEFDEDTREQVQRAVATLFIEVDGIGVNQTKNRYKKLLAFLSKYGLSDAIEQRAVLFKLQK